MCVCMILARWYREYKGNVKTHMVVSSGVRLDGHIDALDPTCEGPGVRVELMTFLLCGVLCAWLSVSLLHAVLKPSEYVVFCVDVLEDSVRLFL
jgi:hypothetical protein